jgi:site-specific DNA-methyltransferase (adenine-specific)
VSDLSLPWQVIQGDCLEVMRGMSEASVDAIVSDPPYGLAFMGKGWDYAVPGVEFWTEALRVAKPGAHIVAFGGTRTFHRLTCAIEDAGWEIRDCLSWLYGSGFPKSHNTALKPAWEPIILARKPLAGTVAANVAQYGTGGLNVDGCRIAITDNLPSYRTTGVGAGEGYHGGWSGQREEKSHPQSVRHDPAGRWPANVCLDEDAAAMLDEQSGKLSPASVYVRQTDDKDKLIYRSGMAHKKAGQIHHAFGDSGGASRFFYTAKASRREREAGLEGMPERVTERYGEQGQGPMPQQTPREHKSAANHHPTVKPIALMRWLCRLVTPPGALVLDPFTGSGTTGCAAVLEGFRFIGAELEAAYVDIARRRIADAASQTKLDL